MHLIKDSMFMFLTSAMTILSSSNAIKSYDYYFYGIGPIEYGVDTAISVSLRYFLNTNIRTRETYALARHGEIFAYSKSLPFSYINEKPSPLVTTLDIKDFNSTKGLDLKLIISSESSQLFNIVLNIYPTNIATINPFELDNMVYSSGNLSCVVDYYDKYTSCEYDFNGLKPTANGNSGVYLEYSDSYFLYNSDYAFGYKSAYIKFNDVFNMFPYLNKVNDNEVHIPLSLTYEGGKIYITDANSYFYNENSMQISSLYHAGFKRTEKFYFPKSFTNYIDNYNFEVVMEDVGFDKVDIIYPIEIINDHRLFGLCTDSEMCVVGGIKK